MEEKEVQNIQIREISDELKESYLDYAMSVIVSRALPDARDGLKPVQRRILWTMWKSGLTHSAKLRKSANVVGEVLGHYHPHGDMAVYDALARMAQNFSLRYPLIEGQGNWGSVDGDSPAAMRYTECRLSKMVEELLEDIEKETVDFIPNYDGTRVEPKVLPAKMPHLLLNGSMGIAVGMATNIPPHNLSEVVDATVHLINNPKATTEELLEIVKGPDFPTGGIIYDKKAIVEAYVTGRGGITCRGVAEIEEGKKGQQSIVVTEIPYQVNKAELVEKIANLVQEKTIEGIRDLRDETDRDGMRIVIELKSDAAPQKILNQLYKHTDLQKDFHLNMISLLDGIQPQLLSLREILAAFLEHRKTVVERRAKFDLNKAKDRAHILEGLAKALSNIDEVIAAIKKSDSREDAFVNLMKKFKFTEVQTNAILDMRLQTLAGLERQKIDEELKEKMKLIAELELLLKSPEKMMKLIKNELEETRQKFGDARRTKVMASGLKEFREEDLIPEEETIITLSGSGYVKRLSPTVFKTQKRGGTGLIGSEVGDEDFLTHFVSGNTHDNILFFAQSGKVFQTKVYDIPVASRTSKGKLIQNFLEIPSEEKISAVISYGKRDEKSFLVMVTAAGVIKKTSLKDFANVRRNGLIALNLKKGDLLQWVKISSGKDEIIIATAGGQSIRFRESQLRPMGRTASGVKAIALKNKDRVIGLDIVDASKKNLKLLIVTEKGFAKQTPLSEYKTQSRGGSGIKTANISDKTGLIVSARILDGEEALFAISGKGQIIKTEISSVRTASRATSGVKIMRLRENDKLAGIAIL